MHMVLRPLSACRRVPPVANLTASQRAVVAFDLLPLLEKEAKGRQRQSNSYRGNGRLPDLREPDSRQAW